jgi:hypothetical protein
VKRATPSPATSEEDFRRADWAPQSILEPDRGFVPTSLDTEAKQAMEVYSGLLTFMPWMSPFVKSPPWSCRRIDEGHVVCLRHESLGGRKLRCAMSTVELALHEDDDTTPSGLSPNRRPSLPRRTMRDRYRRKCNRVQQAFKQAACAKNTEGDKEVDHSSCS